MPGGKRQKSDGSAVRSQRSRSDMQDAEQYASANNKPGAAVQARTTGGAAQVHSGVECDGCGTQPICGLRFQSKVWHSFFPASSVQAIYFWTALAQTQSLPCAC